MEKNGMTWEEFCLSKEPLLKKMFPTADLKNPKTLTDKFQWLKIHDSTFLKAFCADKVTLRDYCKIKLGQDLCIPILAVYDRPEQIDWDSLPGQFVIKCNHGSGFNIIVKDKKLVDKRKIVATLNKWLRVDYGSLSLELYYNLIPRKVFIEKFELIGGKSLADYKFWCFNGVPKFFTINYDYGHGNFNHYDLNGNLLPISRKDFPADFKRHDTMPASLNAMISFAEKLAADFLFVRVDFYEIKGRPVLGELTFIPGAGRMVYEDPTTNLKLGQLLKL